MAVSFERPGQHSVRGAGSFVDHDNLKKVAGNLDGLDFSFIPTLTLAYVLSHRSNKDKNNDHNLQYIL